MRRLRIREATIDLHTRRIPALALTALSTENDQRRALAAGFQRHLPKPIDIDRLRTAVVELATLMTPQGTSDGE
jgi:CheY-like chemotaxis protein